MHTNIVCMTSGVGCGWVTCGDKHPAEGHKHGAFHLEKAATRLVSQISSLTCTGVLCFLLNKSRGSPQGVSGLLPCSPIFMSVNTTLNLGQIIV